MIRKGFRWSLAWMIATFVALVVAQRSHYQRSLFVAFLLVSASTALLSAIVDLALSRLARRQSMDVPLNVRLKRPLWVPAGEYAPFLSLGGVTSAAISLLGWTSIAIGIMGAAVVLFATAFVSDYVFAVNEISVLIAGLTVHTRRGSFAIRWQAVTHIDTTGPALYETLIIHFADPSIAVQGTQPSTETTRRRVASLVSTDGAEGTAVLNSWIGHASGRSLMSSIERGIERYGPKAG